jgi:2,3-bisphosphoglycerate-dependent phosphoglycerate mutase
MAIFLVRHAHAHWTPDEDRPLSARGRRDAERVADVLCAHPISALYASPARRAWQTIAPLAERLDLPVCCAPALRERRLADGPVDDFEQAVRATWADPGFAHPGGESNAAAQRRGVRFVEHTLARWSAAQVVLATHGNLLTLLLQHYDPAIGYAFWQSLTMPDIYRLDVSVGNTGLVRRLPCGRGTAER